MATESAFSPADLDDESWKLLDDLLERFEQSWQTAPPPEMTDFVPSAGHGLRERFLIELIKVDQEYRWESGQKTPLEAYLDDWPELRQKPAVVAELLNNECLTLASTGTILTHEEVRARFPDVCPEINLSALAAQAEQENRSREAVTETVAPSDTSHQPVVGAPSLLDAAPVLTAGQQFGRYQIRGLLGQGGMATVYRAYDPKLHREVALKIPQFTEPEVLKRFVREARAAARVQHVNICPIYDVDQVDGTYYMTMALIEGGSLSKRIKSCEVEPVEAARLVQKLAAALQQVHAEGIVHRDIKPSNVMIDPAGEPLLMDFGLARSQRRMPTGESLPPDSYDGPPSPSEPQDSGESTGSEAHRTTESQFSRKMKTSSERARVQPPKPHDFGYQSDLSGTGSLLGTPSYMSPEQARGEPADARSDIYALGVLLYQLLTGKLPFTGSLTELLEQIAHADPPKPREVRSDLPDELQAICLKAMAKGAADRFESAGELAEALGQHLDTSTRRQAYRRLRNWLACSFGAVALLFAGVVIYFKTGHGTLELDLPPGAKVKIDGTEIDVGVDSVVVRVGEHKLEVTAGSQVVTDDFVIRWRGDHVRRSPDIRIIAAPAEKPQRIEPDILPVGEENLLFLSGVQATIDSDRPVCCIYPSHDGSSVYVAANDSHPLPVAIHNVANGEAVRLIRFTDEPQSHDATVKGIALSRDNRYLFATNYYDRAIHRFDLERNDARSAIAVSDRPNVFAHALEVSPDGRKLVVQVGVDGRSNDLNNDQIAIVDIADGAFRLAGQVRLPDEPMPPDLGISSNGQLAYVVTKKRKSDAPTLYEVRLTPPLEVSRSLAFPEGDLRGVAVSSRHGRVFVSDANHTKIRAIDLESFQVVSEIDVLGFAPGSLAVSPDESLLVALVPESGRIVCIDPQDGRMIGGAGGLERDAWEVRFSGDGRRVFVTHRSPANKVSAWDVDRLLTRIVFSSNRGGGDYELHATALDGKRLMQLTDNRVSDRYPRWSPDGRRIAFISRCAGPPRVCLIDRDGGNRSVLGNTDPAADGYGGIPLSWSPDGKTLAYIDGTYQAIRVVDTATGNTRTLLTGNASTRKDRVYSHYQSLSWSQTDARIFFTGANPSNVTNCDVFALDPQDKKVTQITDEWGKAIRLIAPAVSPNGTQIAVIRQQIPRGLPRNIFLLNPDGTGMTQVTHNDTLVHMNPRWFPNGHKLLYSAGDGGQLHLYAIDLPGSEPHQITFGDRNDAEADVFGLTPSH